MSPSPRHTNTATRACNFVGRTSARWTAWGGCSLPRRGSLKKISSETLARRRASSTTDTGAASFHAACDSASGVMDAGDAAGAGRAAHAAATVGGRPCGATGSGGCGCVTARWPPRPRTGCGSGGCSGLRRRARRTVLSVARGVARAASALVARGSRVSLARRATSRSWQRCRCSRRGGRAPRSAAQRRLLRRAQTTRAR